MLNVAQKVLLKDSAGRILVLKSTDPDGYGNHLDFPGGRMEAGEAPLETLVREVKEETGMRLDPTKAELFHVAWLKGFGDKAQEDVYKTFWIAQIPDSDANLSWEHKEFFWLAPDKLPDDFKGPYREIFDLYVRTRT